MNDFKPQEQSPSLPGGGVREAGVRCSLAHYADKVSFLFKLTHWHFNELDGMQRVSPPGQNQRLAFRGAVAGGTRVPKAPLRLVSRSLPWLWKDRPGRSRVTAGGPLQRADH